MNFLYDISLFVFNKPINIVFVKESMKGNKSKMEGERTKSFFPQSFSIEEEIEGEICKDDEYYLGIVDSYFYSQKGEKEVEA